MPEYVPGESEASRRETDRSTLSRLNLFLKQNTKQETDSVLSHEMHEFTPCSLCKIDLEVGVRIFAVIHLIYCVIMLFVHFLELLNELGVVDIDFAYMVPAQKKGEGYASILGFKPVADERKVGQSWAPTLMSIITDSFQLIAAFFLIPATFRSRQKYCGVWLVATYLLYFPHMFYFGFAIAIGTSWIALILQVIDTLLYTPYAIWIVRSYMDSLTFSHEHKLRISTHRPSSFPHPHLEESKGKKHHEHRSSKEKKNVRHSDHSPPHHPHHDVQDKNNVRHSGRSSQSPPHGVNPIVKEKKHANHSDASEMKTTGSSSTTDHSTDHEHGHHHQNARKMSRKSIQQSNIQISTPTDQNKKPGKRKSLDPIEEISKRIGI